MPTVPLTLIRCMLFAAMSAFEMPFSYLLNTILIWNRFQEIISQQFSKLYLTLTTFKKNFASCLRTSDQSLSVSTLEKDCTEADLRRLDLVPAKLLQWSQILLWSRAGFGEVPKVSCKDNRRRPGSLHRAWWQKAFCCFTEISKV